MKNVIRRLCREFHRCQHDSVWNRLQKSASLSVEIISPRLSTKIYESRRAWSSHSEKMKINPMISPSIQKGGVNELKRSLTGIFTERMNVLVIWVQSVSTQNSKYILRTCRLQMLNQSEINRSPAWIFRKYDQISLFMKGIGRESCTHSMLDVTSSCKEMLGLAQKRVKQAATEK